MGQNSIRIFEDQGSGYPLRVSKVTLKWTGSVKILTKGQLGGNLSLTLHRPPWPGPLQRGLHHPGRVPAGRDRPQLLEGGRAGGGGQIFHSHQVFVLIDLLCCGAILLPVVWSIRHLQVTPVTLDIHPTYLLPVPLLLGDLHPDLPPLWPPPWSPPLPPQRPPSSLTSSLPLSSLTSILPDLPDLLPDLPHPWRLLHWR